MNENEDTPLRSHLSPPKKKPRDDSRGFVIDAIRRHDGR